MKLLTSAALLLLLFLSGCSSVELCYEHPTYGKICVLVDGKQFKRSDLTNAQQKEVDEWLKSQPPK